MRHFAIAIPSFVFCLITACQPYFPTSTGGAGGEAGQGGQGGVAGGGGSPSTGGRGGSHHGGSGGDGGTGGGPTDPACADVPAAHFVVKISAPVVPDGYYVRLAGWTDYPDGSGLGDVGCFMKSGENGVEKATFDFGEVPNKTRYEMYPGASNTPQELASCPGIADGSYYCSTKDGQTVCTVEILCCLGGQELPLAFDGDKPNPVCVTP